MYTNHYKSDFGQKYNDFSIICVSKGFGWNSLSSLTLFAVGPSEYTEYTIPHCGSKLLYYTTYVVYYATNVNSPEIPIL